MTARIDGIILRVMYKVLIVDDEEIIRCGLADRVDWAAVGFRLVGACADGREAMEVAARERPDVVLTDICMPVADGLELALWAQEHLPQAVVVVLSGYDEFEYAREAIRRNVAEYLLKPVSAKDIRSLFLRLKERLDSGKAERDRNQSLEALAETAERFRRERALGALLSGRLTDDELVAWRSVESGALSAPVYAVLLAECDVGLPRADADAVLSSALAALEDAGRGRLEAAVFAYESDRDGGTRLAAALASANDEASLRDGLRAYAEIAAARLRASAGTEALLAVGGVVSGSAGIPLSRSQAEEALKSRFLKSGDGRPVRWEDLPPDTGGDPRLRRSAERLSLALSSSLDDALAAVGEFAAALRASSPRPDRADLEARRLVFALLDAAEALGFARDDLESLALIDQTKPFAGMRRLEDLERAMAAACRELSSALLDRRADPAARRAAEIRRVVADRYAEGELSVGVLCDELGMSRSYLSKIMKKGFGVGFVEYLAGYRVERAKELLRSTDKKLAEIAELVGYADHRYFGAIFKRETGLTPTEFRDAP